MWHHHRRCRTHEEKISPLFCAFTRINYTVHQIAKWKTNNICLFLFFLYSQKAPSEENLEKLSCSWAVLYYYIYISTVIHKDEYVWQLINVLVKWNSVSIKTHRSNVVQNFIHKIFQTKSNFVNINTWLTMTEWKCLRWSGNLKVQKDITWQMSSQMPFWCHCEKKRALAH